MEDAKRATAVAAAIDTEFANSSAETKAETEGAMIQGFMKQIGDIGTIISLIVTAVFVTILLVSFTTMAQSVRERTQELGVLKAVGFSDPLILGVVLGESLFITLLGGLAGLLIGWFMVAVMGQFSFIQTYFPLFFIQGRDLLLGVAIAIFLGIVAGIMPAMQASHLRLADALRREG